jgi:hypothetical protein
MFYNRDERELVRVVIAFAPLVIAMFSTFSYRGAIAFYLALLVYVAIELGVYENGGRDD